MATKFALTYSEVGRRQEALQLTEQVVEARKRTLGEEHPDTLSSMHALALTPHIFACSEATTQAHQNIVPLRYE